eukprot:CAMPEP_0170351364 /NCGR_PEP_ID=MMETSP0116_2-20130129/76981_1 /TAXON_ID=400756 /ORGANISM="Durinskia baltica, Strain CSIRO CS-38" /LENGTH=50 /DNA_ID=CAMNT_0010605265 /DNA_START=49 /DNA_END=201 /DNA_ORIENTATION=+
MPAIFPRVPPVGRLGPTFYGGYPPELEELNREGHRISIGGSLVAGWGALP